MAPNEGARREAIEEGHNFFREGVVSTQPTHQTCPLPKGEARREAIEERPPLTLPPNEKARREAIAVRLAERPLTLPSEEARKAIAE